MEVMLSQKLNTRLEKDYLPDLTCIYEIHELFNL